MSMKELVVCKFAGCNQVYTDPRILPCGRKTCAAHIETMLVSGDDIANDRKMIMCHFCEKTHNFPEDASEFPVDGFITMLLNVKNGSEHEAAKKSFNDVTHLLDKLIKLDKEDFVIDYFERVEADILLEKEGNLQKLLAYYQNLVDDVNERKVKSLHNLKTNKRTESDLLAFKQTVREHQGKLREDKYDFILKTLDGDEAKWKKIQSDCSTLLEKIKSLGEKLKKKIVADQMIRFIPSASSTQFEFEVITCGHLVSVSTKLDSPINCHAASYGPTPSGSPDIIIANNSNTTTTSFSNICQSTFNLIE